jgi:hypothetical protein
MLASFGVSAARAAMTDPIEQPAGGRLKSSGLWGVRTASGVCTQNLEIKNKKPTTRFSTRQFIRDTEKEM